MRPEDLDPKVRGALRRALLAHDPDFIEMWVKHENGDARDDAAISFTTHSRRLDLDAIDTNSDR